VATPAALDALQAAGVDPLALLARHVTGDWGDVDAHDAQENEFSIGRHLRILSAYALPDGVRVWVLTEADRSVTTILLPEEY
jgi:hypothetical protein